MHTCTHVYIWVYMGIHEYTWVYMGIHGYTCIHTTLTVVNLKHISIFDKVITYLLILFISSGT